MYRTADLEWEPAGNGVSATRASLVDRGETVGLDPFETGGLRHHRGVWPFI